MKVPFIFSCSGMFRNVPACSGMFHVPGFIDAPFLCCPSTTTTWNYQILSLLESGNGKAINSTISVQTWARSPLFSSSQNPLLLSNRANWDNGEKVLNDAMSVFQRRFHGRRPCRIVRSLVFEVGSLMVFLKLIVLFRVIYYCQIYSSIRCLK